MATTKEMPALDTPMSTMVQALQEGKLDIQEFQEWDRQRTAAIAQRAATTAAECLFRSFAEFSLAASEERAKLFGKELTFKPKQFSTGSFGWTVTGKIDVPVSGQRTVRCQFSGNAIVIGSKSKS